MKKLFGIMIVVICLAVACGTPPAPRTIVNSFPINASFEKVWPAIIEIFAEMNLPIMNMAKDSGLIVTDFISFRGQDNTRGYCDCGTTRFPMTETDRRGKFNIFVKKTADDSVEMKVNAIFEKVAGYNNQYETTACVSTGKLEAEIYKRVSEKIK